MPTNVSKPIWRCDICGSTFGVNQALAERCEAAGPPAIFDAGLLLVHRDFGHDRGFSLLPLTALPDRIDTTIANGASMRWVDGDGNELPDPRLEAPCFHFIHYLVEGWNGEFGRDRTIEARHLAPGRGGVNAGSPDSWKSPWSPWSASAMPHSAQTTVNMSAMRRAHAVCEPAMGASNDATRIRSTRASTSASVAGRPVSGADITRPRRTGTR